MLQVRGHKWQLLLGGKTKEVCGLRCSSDADRKKYNKCSCSGYSGHKLLMPCGQRTQIFCSRHLFSTVVVTRLWRDSSKSWLVSDSTRKNLGDYDSEGLWLWLDKNDLGTSLLGSVFLPHGARAVAILPLVRHIWLNGHMTSSLCNAKRHNLGFRIRI